MLPKSSLSSDDAPGTGFSPMQTELPGHWIEREAGDFAAPVQILHFRIRLGSPQSVRVCGWSQSQTALWVDGRKPVPAIADPTCSYCKLGAPSFHRGGPGQFDVTPILAAGEHDLVIAWEMPERVGKNYHSIAFRFLPDGSASLAKNGTLWFVTLHNVVEGDKMSASPTNYMTVQIDPANGSLKRWRP